MEKVKSLLKPRPTPQQQLREWQRRLRNECRVLDRQIRGPTPPTLARLSSLTFYPPHFSFPGAPRGRAIQLGMVRGLLTFIAVCCLVPALGLPQKLAVT